MLHDNLSIGNNGHLMIAGVDSVYLAKKYGTPLYVMDEELIRNRCRVILNAIKKYCGEKSMIYYSSKALCFKEIYRIAKDEGIGVDVVSSGELYTALAAGFPADRIGFQGSSKTDAEIKYGIESGIGHFIVDNYEELEQISKIAGELGVCQSIILRLTPGIDPHTFEAVNTGKIDSKFGVAIETGQAFEFTKKALSVPNVSLDGFHCHIGSQVFETSCFRDGADIMLDFIIKVKNELGYEAQILNLGGGFGVRYVESDPIVDYDECIREIGEHIHKKCDKLGIAVPAIGMEPGRCIVGDSCVTLYTVESVKTITGYKSYILVDGGMGDNPRYALYRSEYTALVANKADKPADFRCTLAGRCCESGDMIAEDIDMQEACRNDIVAVLTTGAYNYSMASNYNRVCRPPIVMLKDGKDRLVLRRETFEDLTACDL